MGYTIFRKLGGGCRRSAPCVKEQRHPRVITYCERALATLTRAEEGFVFEHPAIDVDDPVATAKWWCENLGFEITRQKDDETHTTFIVDVTGKIAVELYRARTQPKAPDYASQDPLTLHFGFVTDDVDATIARMVKAGATLVVHEKAPGFDGAILRRRK